jgi:hypothetical protein
VAQQTPKQRQAAGKRAAATRKARTGAKRTEVTGSRLGVIGRQAQRAALIQIGAAATVTDSVRHTAWTWTTLDRVVRELDRFERRGAHAVSARQRPSRWGRSFETEAAIARK